MPDIAGARFSAFVAVLDCPARIHQTRETYTVFEVCLTRAEFIAAASKLSEPYRVSYAWQPIADSAFPPSFRYFIIIEERNSQPMDWPSAYREWLSRADEGRG